MSSGYAVTSTAKVPRIRSVNQGRKMQMKKTFRQRIRSWLFEEDLEESDYASATIEESKFNSEGMRLQVYKANGGFVIETRRYDRKNDDNRNSMYVITEDKNLGEELGKIITMECLR